MFTLVLLHACLLIVFQAYPVNSDFINISECGTSKGCWFVPQGCADKNLNGTALQCDSIITWAPKSDGLHVEMESRLDDLKRSQFTGRYISMAYSKDEKMGDDSVIECIARPDGKIAAYLSFNDETHNDRLQEASFYMLNNTRGSIVNDRIVCRTVRKYAPASEIPDKDKFKVFNLGDRDVEYVLLIARGPTKPGDNYRLAIHTTEDGPAFPWVTAERIRPVDLKIISQMKQTDIPRYVQYNLVKVHGIFMVFGWWVCGSIAILFSRFFKASWPSVKLGGTAVWFQLHRGLMIFGLVLQSLAFAFVFIQAGDFKTCSYACDAEDFALKLHTILGVACTAGALMQPFMAMARPNPDSPNRPIFNWLHWFIGTGSWLIACITIFLSPYLGKAGLRRNFGLKADYVMGGYLASFMLTSLLLEILSAYRKSSPTDKSALSLPMTLLNGPKSDKIEKDANTYNERKAKAQMYQTGLLIFFTIISASLCVALSVLIALNHLV